MKDRIVLSNRAGYFDEGSMEESSQISKNIFEIDDYHIRFTLPEKWEKEIDSQFDLQCTNNNAYFSVFAFYTIDLSEGQSL